MSWVPAEAWPQYSTTLSLLVGSKAAATKDNEARPDKMVLTRIGKFFFFKGVFAIIRWAVSSELRSVVYETE